MTCLVFLRVTGGATSLGWGSLPQVLMATETSVALHLPDIF